MNKIHVGVILVQLVPLNEVYYKLVGLLSFGQISVNLRTEDITLWYDPIWDPLGSYIPEWIRNSDYFRDIVMKNYRRSPTDNVFYLKLHQ
ncbi:hypothetical protein H6781_01375 [Candidatus Nomurabacteria bacterium]|nr:hypothetical protein [Candidatus Kaiserbacteria bacterium]MCB9810233.1 hypothetical protein [Candidatus Nomurabacteria bacterium]MCB9818119.1 hypothetical protein [Candidatus Nomurabacteria bacterium]